MSAKYLISTSNEGAFNKDIIHDLDTKLKIAVVDLLAFGFDPKQGEVHYFVSDTDNDTLLAFETQGYKAHKRIKVLEMIARYCVYVGFVQATIHSSLPSVN